jgi:hypothetical protein
VAPRFKPRDAAVAEVNFGNARPLFAHFQNRVRNNRSHRGRLRIGSKVPPVGLEPTTR